MRDKARIDRILSLIEKFWKENPDLRLGQLLTIINEDFEHNTFYYEDDELEENLKNEQ